MEHFLSPTAFSFGKVTTESPFRKGRTVKKEKLRRWLDEASVTAKVDQSDFCFYYQFEVLQLEVSHWCEGSTLATHHCLAASYVRSSVELISQARSRFPYFFLVKAVASRFRHN